MVRLWALTELVWEHCLEVLTVAAAETIVSIEGTPGGDGAP